jgi:prepilin-type N-terminal cleavage/methylation domain-containing protein
MKKYEMKRHGFTLVELIAVMAALAAVMGASVVLLVQLFDFQRDYEEHLTGMSATARLAAIFRHDVHTYGKPEILSDDNLLLRWATETETIDYTLKPGDLPDQQIIIRTVRQEGQPNRYETYRLPDRTTLHLTDGKGDHAGLVALSLWTAPLGTATPNHDDLNPFDRILQKSLEQRIDPKYAANWRTIIARY